MNADEASDADSIDPGGPARESGVSLADQAAAWVPPWQRVTAAPVADMPVVDIHVADEQGDAAPEDLVSGDVVSGDVVSGDVAPEDVASGDFELADVALADVALGGVAPADVAPDADVPNGSAPSGAAPDDVAPDDVPLHEAAHDSDAPADMPAAGDSADIAAADSADIAAADSADIAAADYESAHAVAPGDDLANAVALDENSADADRPVVTAADFIDTGSPAGADAFGVPGEEAHEPANSASLPGRTDDAAADSDGPADLKAALEAILLVVDEPVAEQLLAQVLDVSPIAVAVELERISAEYTVQGRGFDLRRAAGGWRLYTRPEFAGYVERFVLDGQSVRLTQAALETLAVIAYQQPVTRSRISAIRGVNCDGVVRTLVTRGLIEECGTQPESGAFLSRTTSVFLEKLGLNSVNELPPLAPFLPDDVNGFADAGR